MLKGTAMHGIQSELKPETFRGNLRIKAKSIERAIDVEKSDVIFHPGNFDESQHYL